VGTRREKAGIGQKERKEGATRRESQLSIMWNGCSEMRERDRKEQREILIEERMDERDTEKQGVGDKKKNVIFFGIVIFLDTTVCRNRKARRANKALSIKKKKKKQVSRCFHHFC
jgi:hypothetical protein